MSAKVQALQGIVERLGDREKALIHQRFFKTGPGEYGEGDVFLGIRVPEIRKLVREYGNLALSETMPRTMLRYAIEKFPEDLRRQYLRGEK